MEVLIIKKTFLVIIILLCSCVALGCMGPGSADYSYKLSENYTLVRSSSDCIFISDNKSHIIISSNILGIAWDNNFILAKHTENYFIIDVKTDTKYGPLTKKDFENKRKDLNISKKLKLESPDKYKYLYKSPYD